MVVFQADEVDAARLHKLLASEGLQADIERFGPKSVYVTVNSARPDLPELARSAGRSVRRIYTL
ncbi:MAG TPA: hypothetical protein VEX66_15285, partial [Microlunatus sp.]|nr:hypothetical protein [Microlunatus sp.]